MLHIHPIYLQSNLPLLTVPRMQEAASDAAGQVDGGICFCMQHHVAAGELLVGMETLVGRGGDV